MLKNRIIMIAPLGLVGLTIISGAFLMSSYSFAEDSTVDNVNITVPVSCSIEGTGMNTHNANVINGTYQADIGTTTMKAYCNDSEGFAIYANGYTGDTLGNNKLIGSSTNEEIVTGTATSTPNPDMSNWAMKLATSSSATYPLTLDNGFGSYSNVPASYTKVAHRDSGTDLGTSAEGATLTSTYAAYISKTQPADTYVGQVIYTLVHPASEEPLYPVDCETGYICYQPNSSSVIGSMGKQPATNSAEVTLWAPNYKREGYGFAGWSYDYDYVSSNWKGPIFGPNETIKVSPHIEDESGSSLYAVWIKSAGTLQDWDGCDSLDSIIPTALTDERDGNTYAVAKLADGKCWTIENLRLDDSAELSSTNTHNPSLPITNVYDATNPTTSNHLSATTDPTATAWCQANSSACDDQSMLATNNTTLFTNNTSTSYSTESNVYSYGNYYNWYSATAGHGKYGSSYASGYIAPGDICPAGWHLPTGNTTGEYYALNTALNAGADDSTASNGLRSYPNNFVYSGGVNGSSVLNRSFFGRYWSSSALDSSYAYGLYFSSSYVYPGTYGSSNVKYSGRMVRCVAGV